MPPELDYSGLKNCPNVLTVLAICLLPLEVNYVIFQKYSAKY